jgi:glutamate dehydrogenase
VVEIVTDDMPFLVDSVRMELARHGLGLHRLLHPVIGGEAFIRAEVDRHNDPEVLDQIAADLRRVLGDVRSAVEDWPKMVGAINRVAAKLESDPPPVDIGELEETKAFLRWLGDDHFTVLGFREYDLVTENGEDALRVEPGTGLGILRDTASQPASLSFAKMAPEVRQLVREPRLLTLTQANSVATVHRPSRLDYVGIKKIGSSGEPVGEWRFLGLYTSTVYNASPVSIPVLRRKVQITMERAGFAPASHGGKDLLAVIETFPRDELFQISEDELFETAMGILNLQERRRVRLFVRRDRFGRFFSCLVFVPRDRYNTDTRIAIQRILMDALHGTSVEYETRVSESVLARLHYTVRIEPGDRPEFDVSGLERRLAEATRTWADDLQEVLLEDHGEDRGLALFRRYQEAFPAGYRADYPARVGAADIERIEALGPDGDLSTHLYCPLEAPKNLVRFKLYRSATPILVSDVLPLLENMGMRVVDERPYEIRPEGGNPVWIYDFGLTGDGLADLETGGLRALLIEAFAAVWGGETESDGFNRLVTGARIAWREIAVLRAYAKYLRQVGTTFSQAYMEQTLTANPGITRLLIGLFHARFDPSQERAGDADRLAGEIEAGLDQVASLDDDRILRNYLALVLATVRTNWYQDKTHLSFKFDPGRVPDLPLPRPQFEIFVYSPRVEGVHLRGGKVARGGIRWSDRREDFRTEILGLMKAQMVKNAVIVPVGAKGGFVVKQPADEVVECYRIFIRGLLDLTDNLVRDDVVPPPSVVRYDDDDPYLVVAADKGTAAFSDVANGIANEYEFWLGDAFASGGSSGYDHKKMGITARGAWESVKRHGRALGFDIQATDFTAIGIGDMSGDVFGNGMLLSRHIRLVAAFDHRHMFVDPDPDPELSFRERERLFALPGSSWDDYNVPGASVYPRTAKSVPLTKEVRRVLGVDDSIEHLTPNEVVSAILRAPVDLLWNGGVGTYVKASSERNADVGDRTNDAVRVDARDLRCRMVGEGGNLGFTQRARVEFALAGGLINTDAIDNSAGVDCSDHEVNIKILLDAVVADGDLTEKHRNALLTGMTDEVGHLVVADNYNQTRALSLSSAQAASLIDAHARYIQSLAASGRLDRELEALPSEEELADRKAADRGLTSPEFAVLLAYAKNTLYHDLLASDVPEDPYLGQALERYFPQALRTDFADAMRGHRLRREIIANRVANDMVDRQGTTFAFRIGEETGATAADIARAYTVAREVFGEPMLAEAVAALDNQAAVATQTAMLLEARKLVERGTRWLLRHRCSGPIDLAAEIGFFGPTPAEMAARFPELLSAGEQRDFESMSARLVSQEVPLDLAHRVAGFNALSPAFDIAEIAAEAHEPVTSVAAVYFLLGDRLELHWLRDQVNSLPRANRWQTLARSALRDDLDAHHRAMTAAVLKAPGVEREPAARIEAWLAGIGTTVDWARRVLSDVKASRAFDLATLSVAIREMSACARP